MFDSSEVQRLFDRTLRKEEEELRREGYDNYEHDNGKTSPSDFHSRAPTFFSLSLSALDGVMDYDTKELRNGESESRSTARAAISLTGEIMTVLLCDLNGTDSSNL